MSGNLWMFSDMLDDEDIEMLKRDFITYYQGADYYGLGLKVFTRMAREAGAVYKIGKKVLIRRILCFPEQGPLLRKYLGPQVYLKFISMRLVEKAMGQKEEFMVER